MTSHFDKLMMIHEITKNDERFKPIVDFLFQTCIEEANKKKANWNFETWKNTVYGKTVLSSYGEEEAKVYTAVTEGLVYKSDLKQLRKDKDLIYNLISQLNLEVI